MLILARCLDAPCPRLRLLDTPFPGSKDEPDLSGKDDPCVVDQHLQGVSISLTSLTAWPVAALYGTTCGGHLPVSEPRQEVIDAAQDVLLSYEQLAYGF